jgi:putative ABC transport system permease protein
VFAHGLRTAGVGIAIGIAASMLLTRYVQSMLYGVQPHDALVLGGVAALLAVVGGVACYVPARRALAIAPTVALRDV